MISDLFSDNLPALPSTAILISPDHFSMALLLDPIYPTDTGSAGISTAIGGTPWLPSECSWPRDDDGVPLHFIAQIDLGSLPCPVSHERNIVNLPDFPDKGILFFFLEGGGTGDSPIYIADQEPLCKVIYSQNVAMPEHLSLPIDLPPLDPVFQCFGLLWDKQMSNPEYYPGVRQNLILPRIGLRAIPCLTHTNFSELTLIGAGKEPGIIKREWLKIIRPYDHPSLSLFTWAGIRQPWKLIKRTLMKATSAYDPAEEFLHDISDDRINLPRYRYGFPYLRWSWLTNVQNADDFHYTQWTEDIPREYPWHWIQIEKTAFAALYHFKSIADNGSTVGITIEAIEQHVESMRHWIETAGKHGEFDAVDPNNRKHFQEWLKALADVQHFDREKILQQHQKLNPDSKTNERSILFQHRYYVTRFVKNLLHDGFYMSWPYSLASGRLDNIPPDFIESMRPTYAPAGNRHSDVHQLFGEIDRVYQIDEPRKRGWVPLLQISADNIANTAWGFGEYGRISFWIAPDALKRGDFSEVAARLILT